MSRLKAFAAVGALALQAAAASAADMPSTLPPDLGDPPAKEWIAPADFNTGWYLRGDVGYNWGLVNSAESAPGFVDPTNSELGDGFVGGLGAGIKTKWLRTDFTVDYHAPMKYTGSIATPDDTTAKISAISLLFNGYLDLGTWYRITPYIGAGAGASYVRAFDYTSTGAPPFTGDTSKYQWNFTWAVMGGFAYMISPNLQVDVGYRFISFGDVETASDAIGAMKFKDVGAHEVRVGLRWSFDDLKVQTW